MLKDGLTSDNNQTLSTPNGYQTDEIINLIKEIRRFIRWKYMHMGYTANGIQTEIRQ